MYSIIRFVIGCVLFGVAVILIKKSKVGGKRRWYIGSFFISAVLVVISAFLPFENCLITFDSPKAAYEYFNLGKSNIELIVEGEDCDFIVDRKNDSDTYLIIPKTADGWKIGVGSNTKRILQKLSNGIVLYVYQYKDTSDYFITILDTNGGKATVSDEYNSEFRSVERSDKSLGKTFVTYYAHISGDVSPYSVTVNNRKITVIL